MNGVRSTSNAAAPLATVDVDEYVLRLNPIFAIEASEALATDPYSEVELTSGRSAYTCCC